MTRYYIEHDGRLLTIQEEGIHRLPTREEVEEAGVPFETMAERTLGGVELLFGQAKLDHHPEAWPQKDDLAGQGNVDLLVRQAIDASHFRPVVGVVARHEGRVLLVLPARGVAKGHWTLPGGFLNAFEQPEQGARREVREETGVELTTCALAGTITYYHGGAPYPILGLAFTGEAADPELSPREEEIEAARWFQVADAQERSAGFAAEVLERLAHEGAL